MHDQQTAYLILSVAIGSFLFFVFTFSLWFILKRRAAQEEEVLDKLPNLQPFSPLDAMLDEQSPVEKITDGLIRTSFDRRNSIFGRLAYMYDALTELSRGRYLVFPQVSLSSIVTPYKGLDPSMRMRFADISQKETLDFVLVNPETYQVYCVLDSVSEDIDRPHSDKKTSSILYSAKIPYIEFEVGATDDLDRLEDLIGVYVVDEYLF